MNELINILYLNLIHKNSRIKTWFTVINDQKFISNILALHGINENIRSLMESVEQIANGKTPTVHIPNLPSFPIPQNTSSFLNSAENSRDSNVFIHQKKCPFKVVKEERKYTNHNLSEYIYIYIYIEGGHLKDLVEKRGRTIWMWKTVFMLKAHPLQ